MKPATPVTNARNRGLRGCRQLVPKSGWTPVCAPLMPRLSEPGSGYPSCSFSSLRRRVTYTGDGVVNVRRPPHTLKLGVLTVVQLYGFVLRRLIDTLDARSPSSLIALPVNTAVKQPVRLFAVYSANVGKLSTFAVPLPPAPLPPDAVT